jgi:hypothetical protein
VRGGLRKEKENGKKRKKKLLLTHNSIKNAVISLDSFSSLFLSFSCSLTRFDLSCLQHHSSIEEKNFCSLGWK